MSDQFFSVNLQLTKKQTYSFNDTFNINDQDKWVELRTHASKVLSKSALKRFPTKASPDIKIWFELYRYLPSDFYESQDEDLGSDQPDHIYLVLNTEDEEAIDHYSST
jgi:hypothetical protein